MQTIKESRIAEVKEVAKQKVETKKDGKLFHITNHPLYIIS